MDFPLDTKLDSNRQQADQPVAVKLIENCQYHMMVEIEMLKIMWDCRLEISRVMRGDKSWNWKLMWMEQRILDCIDTSTRCVSNDSNTNPDQNRLDVRMEKFLNINWASYRRVETRPCMTSSSRELGNVHKLEIHFNQIKRISNCVHVLRTTQQ